jgi:Tol biopolymer transport system component/imidazolonepropionase-like amidohydrolase
VKKLALALLASVAPVALLIAAAPTPATKKKDVAAEINAPRSDARKIAFEAREATWSSVDVSPDGKTLVFDLLGDIYALPVGGGEAKALTSGPAWDAHPRFSPDGKTIAFSSDRSGIENVWLMGEGGKDPRALTEEKDAYVRNAAWTPDGNYLVVRKEDGKRAGIPPVELWLFHREGGSGVRLVSSDELSNSSGPAPSHDGRYIYFAARQAKFSYTPDLSQGLWQIYRYDRTTGETAPITSGFGGAVRPALSPDDKTLLFVGRRDSEAVMVVRDLATGAERVLARGITRDEQEGFTQMDLWPGYAFLPDGKAVVFSNHGKLVRLELAGGQPQEIPFVAKVEQFAAPRVTWQEHVESGPVAARILRWPSQSPDGRFVAFDAFGRVYIQEIAAGKTVGAPRRLTSDAATLPRREYAPAFSPDGTWIAYVTWSDADGGHVWKAPLAGGEPQRLTRAAGHYAKPTFSPSGDRLCLTRGSGLEFRGRQPEDEDAFEIHWMDASGGETHFVASVKPATANAFHPQAFWSADGSRLYYRDPLELKKPTDDPKNDLVSVRLDGTDKKRHLRVPAVSELAPSPDGRWAIFVSRDNVYVTPIPAVATKEPAEVSIKDGAVPVYRLSDEAGSYVGWADGGQTVTWGLARAFHRLPLASAIDFARQQKKKAEDEKKAGEKAGDKKTAAGAKDKDKKEDEGELKLPSSEAIEFAVSMPRVEPKGSFVLKNARVITMKGDEVLTDADILVTGNRIAAIGPTGTLAVPADAKPLDARGKTVIPGLIDTHAHMHYSGFENFPDTKWEYAANLAYGVTTVYDPSAPSIDVFAQAEMVEAGLLLGPRVYSSGDVLYGGQQTDIWAEVNSQADARRQVRRMKAYGARMIKVYQQPRRSQRLYFAEACRELHMLLTAEGGGELHTDLSMALDGFTSFEHSLPVELRADAVKLLAQTGTYYTPTLIVSYGGPWGEQYFWQNQNPHDDPKLNRFVPHRSLDTLGRRHPWIWPDEYHFPSVAEGAAAVARAGGHVSLGAHGQLQGLGAHWELWMMAGEGGRGQALTPMEALRAATIAGADKIGFAPDLGSVEAGKLADLVVLDADPLADIHNSAKIRWVVKNGQLFEADTLKQVWPEERPLPAFFWQKGN